MSFEAEQTAGSDYAESIILQVALGNEPPNKILSVMRDTKRSDGFHVGFSTRIAALALKGKMEPFIKNGSFKIPAWAKT